MAKPKKNKLSYIPIEKNGYGYGQGQYRYGFMVVKYDYELRKITEINKLELYNDICRKKTIDNIKDYCLDRFIAKTLNDKVVHFITKSGYYGEECDFIVDNEFSESLNQFIDRLNNINEDETKLIEEVLILEYGYILPELKDKTWIFFNNIPLIQINPAAGMKHVDFNIVNQYKKQYTEDKYTLTCLCDNRRLIDGYHRFAASNQLKLDKIAVIEPV
jgi:hypothetical protein